MISGGVINKKNTPYPFFTDKKTKSAGSGNINWSLPLNAKNISLNFAAIKALATLFQVNFYIKFFGFYHTICLIKKKKKKFQKYITPNNVDLNDMANIVNKACLYYPYRTKCLEWAITYLLLALKRGWKCNLEIGVQNYPFMAHAWVECNKKVIMDDQSLRSSLAIILNEPFRK
jgi:hypothetical protein